MEVYTIGHSTHSKTFFLEMLQSVSVKMVIDVRAFPGSRKLPAYSQDVMPGWLEEAGMAYYHIPQLGGRRSRSGDVGAVLNDGWDNQSFHNYADYTLSQDFQEGMNELIALASKYKTAYFCAERHPSRCHRLLISNWLKVNGWDVGHLINKKTDQVEVIDHALGRWGAMPIIEEDGTVVYPRMSCLK